MIRPTHSFCFLVKRLARHAPQGITLKHYQDFSLFDMWSEIEKIPSPLDGTEVNAAIATGTDDSQAVVGNVVGACGFDRPQGALCDRVETANNSERSTRKHYNTREKRRSQPPTSIGATGFEPATSCSQSRRATGLRHAPFMLSVQATNRLKLRDIRSNAQETVPTVSRRGTAPLSERRCRRPKKAVVF